MSSNARIRNRIHPELVIRSQHTKHSHVQTCNANSYSGTRWRPSHQNRFSYHLNLMSDCVECWSQANAITLRKINLLSESVRNTDAWQNRSRFASYPIFYLESPALWTNNQLILDSHQFFMCLRWYARRKNKSRNIFSAWYLEIYIPSRKRILTYAFTFISSTNSFIFSFVIRYLWCAPYSNSLNN